MNNIKVLDNFISSEDCDLTVEYFKSNISKFNNVKGNRKLYINPEEEFIHRFISKYIKNINRQLNNTYYVREAMLSIYETGSFLMPHIDYDDLEYINNLGALFYLNDDFTGGELVFIEKNISFKPKRGTLILFPCNQSEYTHKVNTITSGTRYTIPAEISTNKDHNLFLNDIFHFDKI